MVKHAIGSYIMPEIVY